MTKPHDIHDFIASTQRELQDEYLRIQKRSVEDPGTAGDQGEENWAEVLRNWLPAHFHIVTKGRILTESGEVSPQIDVLVLSPAYPPLLLNKKLYLSSGVVAAFECKTTLVAKDIEDALNTSVVIRRNMKMLEGSPFRELNSPMIYGLLAHSHSWKKPQSKPLDNITNALRLADATFVNHPRECIDFVCVADLACWTTFKLSFFGPYSPHWNEQVAAIYGKEGSATTGYVCHAIGGDRQEHFFSPIGVLLSRLYSKLAWYFHEMRTMEVYFRQTKMMGAGEGALRCWPLSIYSQPIQPRVSRGEFVADNFEEWSFFF